MNDIHSSDDQKRRIEIIDQSIRFKIFIEFFFPFLDFLMISLYTT